MVTWPPGCVPAVSSHRLIIFSSHDQILILDHTSPFLWSVRGLIMVGLVSTSPCEEAVGVTGWINHSVHEGSDASQLPTVSMVINEPNRLADIKCDSSQSHNKWTTQHRTHKIQPSNVYFPKWFLCHETSLSFLFWPTVFHRSRSCKQTMCELEVTSCSSGFVWQRDYEAISYFISVAQIACCQPDEVHVYADTCTRSHTRSHVYVKNRGRPAYSAYCCPPCGLLQLWRTHLWREQESFLVSAHQWIISPDIC